MKDNNHIDNISENINLTSDNYYFNINSLINLNNIYYLFNKIRLCYYCNNFFIT